jgi:hypothetical protein
MRVIVWLNARAAGESVEWVAGKAGASRVHVLCALLKSRLSKSYQIKFCTPPESAGRP